ncbi:hypothetical protein TSAR_016656 [Trichomalopsis sarcophagae]|uniref:Uncharacterized protein n=1 Tax=Trichomalopsis sarcophagae TaxID=543379 RepID=A0A232EZU7_9HYME|nr:hypothetical protein TSAR_016656 [Trichomalopsis sarcophagae]
MNRWIIICCSLLLLLSLSQDSAALPILGTEIALKTILNIGVGIAKAIMGAHNVLKEKPILTPGESVLSDQLKTLSADVKQMKYAILEKITTTLRDKLTSMVNELFKLINDVQRLYMRFYEMYGNLGNYTRKELENFADVGTSYSLTELRTTLEMLHETLVGLDFRDESIITIIATKTEAYDTMCVKNGQSSQQLINNLYELVVTSHTKGLTVVLFCYYLREALENANYDYARDIEVNHFKTAITSTSEKIKQALNLSPREIWKCDPQKHQQGQTFLKLNPVFQTFFIYQSDIKYTAWYGAFHSCESMVDKRLWCRSHPCEVQPTERRCYGKLRDCEYVAKWFQICHAPPKSDRRYDWIKIYKGGEYTDIHGVQNGRCDNTQGVGSIWPFHTCACNCESESREEDRFFSLLDVKSDIDDNKVITGLRLVKKGHVYHIEIQEGTLGINASIIDASQWKNTDELFNQTTLSSDEIATYHYQQISSPQQNNYRITMFNEWVDWHKNNLVFSVTYDQSAVNLNTRELGPEDVLTGVRFQQSGTALDIQVHGTPFDYATGRLDTKNGRWIFINRAQNVKEIVLKDPDIPVNSKKSDRFSKNNNEFIRFRRTNFRKDVGQNVIPYLDIQDIVTNPPIPLSGAGIYHKYQEGYGGFLGLKIVHYDYAQHWD